MIISNRKIYKEVVFNTTMLKTQVRGKP